MILNGDCIEEMKKLEENSIDSIVSDPPYGLSFMSRKWDCFTPKSFQEFSYNWGTQALRVLKPGGYCLAFSGDRTYHRMVCGLEDAGFKIKTTLTWLYGAGFPKSLNICLDITKSIDKYFNELSLDNIWSQINNLNNVKYVEKQSQKNQIEIGMNIEKRNIVVENVFQFLKRGEKISNVTIVEKNSIDLQAISTKNVIIVVKNVEIKQKPLQNNVKYVIKQLQNQNLLLNHINIFIVQGNVVELVSEKIKNKLKEDDLLKIWLGDLLSLKKGKEDVLCVEILKNLKLIILNQLKNIQNSDMQFLMEYATVTNVIITKSTMELLITFMENMLQKKAREYEHLGTALKPSLELIVMAQKPYINKYSYNTIKYGVGGLNIDGCRVQYQPTGEDPRVYDESKNIIRVAREASKYTVSLPAMSMPYAKPNGRFPSNVLLSHHPECQLIGSKKVKTSTLLKTHKIKDNKEDMFSSLHTQESITQNFGKNGYDTVDAYDCHPDCPIRLLDGQSGNSKSSNQARTNKPDNTNCYGKYKVLTTDGYYNDKGGASRFFKTFAPTRFIYSGKAHKSERVQGCEDLFWRKDNDELILITKEEYDQLPNEERAQGNPVSTLKPISVMRWLIRLVTPPNGIVLDPFAGSGTTGIACIIEGMDYILIEKRERFANVIIPKRLEFWSDPVNWSILKDHNALPKLSKIKTERENRGLSAWL